MSQFEAETGFDAGGGEAEQPFEHDPEFRQELDAYVGQLTRPFQEFIGAIEQERALAAGEDRAAELFAAESSRAGVEVDTAEAVRALDAEFAAAAQLMVASGIPPQEVQARLFTPGMAEMAIRMYVDGLARDEAAKGGDELGLVKKYFPTARPREDPLPRSDEQQQIIDRALKGA